MEPILGALDDSRTRLNRPRRADPVLLPAERAGYEVAGLILVAAGLDYSPEATGAHHFADLDGRNVAGRVDQPHAHGGVLVVSEEAAGEQPAGP